MPLTPQGYTVYPYYWRITMHIELHRADVIALHCVLTTRILRLRDELHEREPRYADPNDGEHVRQADARYLANLITLQEKLDAALA